MVGEGGRFRKASSMDRTQLAVPMEVASGELVGEEALLQISTRTFTLVAVHTSQVWAVETALFAGLMRSSMMEQVTMVRSYMDHSPLLAPLSLVQKDMLALHASLLELPKGAYLVQEGEAADALYILRSGALAVVRDGREVYHAKDPGICLGERGLLEEGNLRVASVLAAEDSLVVEIRDQELGIVFGASFAAMLHQNIVRNAFKASCHFADVTHETIEQWAASASFRRFSRGEDLLLDEALHGLVVVLDGEVETAPCDAAGGATEARVVSSYEYFGEKHLQEPIQSWLGLCRAVGPGGATVAWLPRREASRVCAGLCRLADLAEHHRRVSLVKKVFIFRHLTMEQMETLVRSFTMRSMRQGEDVITQGDRGREFYLIVKGVVSVLKNGNFVCHLHRNNYFGERALLYDEARTATVRVSSEDVELCVLTKDVFLNIVQGGMRQHLEHRTVLQETDLQFEDLVVQRIVGKGGYGVVKLVRHQKSVTRYALKCVERARLKTEKDRNLLRREREILIAVDHPFILKMVRSFKDALCVYFLTELVTGGELLDILDQMDTLNRYQTQFYLGSVVVAFEYLHDKCIAYRDLKPENVLLDGDGYVKLIDFGAAKKLDGPMEKSYTLLGTPQFMAPEMVLSQGYTPAADVWAIGICMHEFMVGYLPFDGKDQISIFKQIVSKNPLRIPENLDDVDARELMARLLQKSPDARIQPTAGGYRELKGHPFFSDFSWTGLIARELRPPVIPKKVERSHGDDDPRSLGGQSELGQAPPPPLLGTEPYQARPGAGTSTSDDLRAELST